MQVYNKFSYMIDQKNTLMGFDPIALFYKAISTYTDESSTIKK